MKFSYSTLYVALVAVLTIQHSTAQVNQLTIRFIGNCGLHITDGTTNLYSDFPYKSGAYNYMEFDDSEVENIEKNSIFLFTHKHADHFSGKNMRRTLKNKGGRKFTPRKSNKLLALAEETPDFDVQVFKTRHLFSLAHKSYLITWHGVKLYFSGDTEHAETIGEMKGLDMAFIPLWILNDSKRKGIEINAEKIGIYHLYPQTKFAEDIPEKYIIFLDQGYEFSIPY